MIFDGEKKVYILSEQEYDEMFDGEAHANLELIKATNQIADLSKKVKTLKGLLEHALQTMGQIAKLSEDKVDSVQCATSICLIQERLKEMEGVK